MAEIVPFPAAARVGHARRIARSMAKSDPRWSEAHLRQQLRLLAKGLEKRGVASEEIAREWAAYETTIRAELVRLVYAPQRPTGGAA